ncbi:MAG: hypothetical protein KAI99_21525, partial [Cyclobacteriaceae bacterium]|nr:hypothetical protein [Cyclobacteriaceae bacterium]
IMFTDIVGYTALMGKNSQKALELVRISKEIQKPLVKKYNGKWLKEMGDGALAQFSTALDAVNCAVEIQEHARAKFDGKLRIGIHLGDITIENDDVYGDGVNVASRLESIADPGGIYISDAILKAIQGQSDAQTKYLGEVKLKNVVYGVRTYALQGVGLPVPEIKEKQSDGSPWEKVQKRGVVQAVLIGLILVIVVMYFYPKYFSEKGGLKSTLVDNSIAILPFVDKSPDGDQVWYTNGIMEEVRNYLVQVQNLKISSGTATMGFKDSDKSYQEIGEELRVAYMLTGSVMRLDNNIKINVQLIDVKSGQYQWTESYDQQLTGVFTILSEIAQKVASTLDAQIQSQIIERMEQMPTENMEAYDLYLKASGSYLIVSTDYTQRNEWLNEAIQLDSNFASAYALLGSNILSQAGFAQNKNPKDVGEEAKAMIEKALLLDPLDGQVHAHMANYSLWYEKDFNKAEIHRLISIRQAPSHEGSYTGYLNFLLATGRFQEAIPIGTKLLEIAGDNPGNQGRNALLWAFNNEEEKMNENIRIAKQAPDDILAITESARAYLILKQYDQVLEILHLSQNIQQIPRVMGLKSIAYYKTGDIENHNRELNALIQKSTETAGGSPSFYIAMIYSSKGIIDEAFRWLEKSFQDNEIELHWLKVEPEFEPLHNDPRWQEMLDKVGFPE